MPRKIMRLIFIGIFVNLCLLFSIPSNALVYSGRVPVSGTDQLSPFDQHFVSLLKRWRVPGASVTVMRNGQIIMSHGYGWSDLRTHQFVEPNSLFRVGSVSKAITAVTILHLVQQNKLGLDDKVFQLLNDLQPLNKRENPLIYQITVRNLLQMASGWQTDAIDPMFGPWTAHMLNQLGEFNQEIPPNCETAARLMMGTPLRFKPGTQFSYSNINYCLLGLITNKITNTPYNYQNYEAFVQQNLLAPIGITDMRIGDTLLQNRLPNEVRYYTYPDYTPDPNDIVTTMAHIDGLPYSNSQILKKNFADGGWVASSVDLAKFLQGINNHTLISSNMLRVMLSKPTYRGGRDKSENYFAMGWSVRRLGKHLYWYKTGSFTGTYAYIMQSDTNTSYAAVFNIKPSQRSSFLPQLQRLLISAG